MFVFVFEFVFVFVFVFVEDLATTHINQDLIGAGISWEKQRDPSQVQHMSA